MTPRTDPDDEPWDDDDPDGDLDEDMEYDEFPEDLIDLDDEDEDEDDEEEEEEEEELRFDSRGAAKHLTARQRIEIAREDRWLKSMMADFDDIDDIDRIEGFSDCYVGELSH